MESGVACLAQSHEVVLIISSSFFGRFDMMDQHCKSMLTFLFTELTVRMLRKEF